jgi:hypothetical protein
MKLATTLVFTSTTANIIYTTKIIAQAKLHMQPEQQWYNYRQKTDMNFREAQLEF